MKAGVKSFAWVIVLFTTLAGMARHMIPQANYNHILVVINSNRVVSEQVGTYFASARGIPANNIVRVNAPTLEVISGADFAS